MPSPEQGASTRILSKKLGQRAAFRLCGLAEVSTIICDEQPDAEWLSPFINAGLKSL